MDDYEVKREKNVKRNKKFLDEFEIWLKNKNLGKKTIDKHVSNVDLYINDFLNYYDVTKMESGLSNIYMFLDDWFIRKCLWSSKTSLKATAASIKKFYECMCELSYVSNDDYQNLCRVIKDNMEDFLNSLEEYDNMDDDFDFL